MGKNIYLDYDFNGQIDYIDKVKESLLLNAKNKVPLAFVKTYGCQQNVSDGEKIKGILSLIGYEFTNIEEDADLIIFNTCAIREHAEDRVFGNIGALKYIKKKYPSTIIAMCGCMMEQKHIEDKIKTSFPFVDLVFGTNRLHKLPELLYTVVNSKSRVFECGLDDNKIIEGIPIRRDKRFKAWLPIMYGCDNFCSYCIVPYVRGRERSRRPEDILDEATKIINNGYKDITLLGQNVNSYGKNLDEDINFAQLLNRIDSIPGDYRIRFMTSHPKDATKELIDTISESEHICHHLHLPFQSGSNKILRLMNRKYTVDKYLNIINYAKSKMPDVSITSDIIVGFPGETYDDFCKTIELVEEVRFTSLFTFIYSPRIGTPAAEMNDPIPYEKKVKWFQELLKVQEGIAARNCRDMVGKTYRVLVEESKGNKLMSRTGGNVIVEFEGASDLVGSFKNVKITEARNWILKGQMI